MSESHPEHTKEMDSIIVYLQGADHFHTDDKNF